MNKIDATEKFLKDHGIEDWGNFNQHPTPCVKSTIEEFWRTVSIYGFGPSEFRQVFLDNYMQGVHLVAYHDRIYMIHVEYSYDNTTRESKYEPECWRVGCLHEWSEVSTIYGDHWRTCKKCGYKYCYDSSG